MILYTLPPPCSSFPEVYADPCGGKCVHVKTLRETWVYGGEGKSENVWNGSRGEGSTKGY